MEFVSIASVKVPVLPNKTSFPVFPSSLVETDSVQSTLQKILYPMLEGIPVLLVGDAGVGKNALIYYINSRRNQPTLRFSFNEDTLPEDLIGSYRILLDGKGFTWSNGPLTNALDSGLSFVADEMNLCAPNIIKRFSSVYESNYLDLLEGSGERIKSKTGFWFIGTQNPSEGFEGRKPLPFDITKHFAVVYVDPYSPDEMFYILKKLYPALGEEVLQKIIRVTIESENRIKRGDIGKGDLEKYHFNLRTLQKYCNRLMAFGKEDRTVALREALYLFQELFRKNEDRSLQTELIESEFGGKIKSRSTKGYVQNGTIFWNDKEIKTWEEKKTISILSKYPTPEPILGFLDQVLTAIQCKENILIEFREDQDPQEFLPLFTELTGIDIESVMLSKGMHTSDVVGALKPTRDGKIESVDWVDGPLTRAIRNGKIILISGLESAGAELVEKMNMLTDDARSLTLPPESGESIPIQLKETSIVFGLKTYRHSKSVSTISRAFRNRFTPVIFPELEDAKVLEELLSFYLPEGVLPRALASFHTKAKELAEKRTIGSANLQPYRFGISNLLKWKNHIYRYNEKDVRSVAYRGGTIAYTNQISDPKERKELERLLDGYLSGVEVVSELFDEIEEKKKTFTVESNLDKKKWWDPELHERDPLTGEAKKLNSGNELKRGIEINTPETGGQTKEGADAWYGSETQGNNGQGEPAGGGGGWGYRTEELYKQFLKKRRLLWDYSMIMGLDEFKKVFGKELEEVELNLEQLFDPEIDIHRMYRNEGSRVDARKYISYKSGKGDTKIFDKTTIEKNDEKLKGVEVTFLVSKCRRIFNFEYSVAMLSALLVSLHILNEHDIATSVNTFCDIKNSKDTIDIFNSKTADEDYTPEKEQELFNSFCKNWHGDSIPEYQLLSNCERFFSPDAQTKIVVILSDFRGQRAKMDISDEIGSFETRKLKEAVLKNQEKNYVFLGVGLGSRYIAEHVFSDSLQITGDNFFSMANLIGAEIARLIQIHHSLRT
ncbi:AAA family ATPase [Leptospira ilyithenensis]|uniref:ATPase n=1 Tax=Leptospira ilyithenensis TaxID=2484901 RepID=A0A4V3JXA9_9LEPT|nr:AAA family ATPase [Leptospira ilyithenensis]TGN11987.1 ATPase [Leptospira ilyithenensis]